MEKKRDKKKVLVLGLLLFAVVGLVGYGVYSYYYTSGSFDTVSADDNEDADNVIRITGEFDPNFRDNGSSSAESDFLGRGGTITLDCPATVGNETITCTASATVSNEGTTSVRVRVYDGYSSISSSSGVESVSADNPYFDWYPTYDQDRDTIVIGAGESATLSMSVDVNVGNTSSSDEGVEVNAPVESGSFTAYASFRLQATQLNNNN